MLVSRQPVVTPAVEQQGAAFSAGHVYDLADEDRMVAGASRGHDRAASSVSNRIASKKDRIRSPFSGGTSTRRCCA